MIQQYLFQNAAFAISLVAAVATFAASWLFLDAGVAGKRRSSITTALGFLCVSVSFILMTLNPALANLGRAFGYVLILLGYKMEKLPQLPDAALLISTPHIATWCVAPLAAAICSLAYIRKATAGLEHHLKPLAAYFAFITLVELLLLPQLLPVSTLPQLQAFQLPFAPNWLIGQITLLIASLYLLRWIFKYLLAQIFPQLFFFCSLTLIAVIVTTTTTFTGTLLTHLLDSSQAKIHSSAQVLRIALDSISQQNVATLHELSTAPELAPLFTADAQTVSQSAKDLLLKYQLDNLILVNSTGEVIFNSKITDTVGTTTTDSLVTQALSGTTSSQITVDTDSPLPHLQLDSAVPVKTNGQLIGALISGKQLDQAFVSGLSRRTGLDLLLFAQNQLVASSLADTVQMGMIQNDANITTSVLKHNEEFSGESQLGPTPLFGTYLPLTDSDNTPVGMLFIGNTLPSIANQMLSSFSTIYALSIAILIISIVPIFFISRHITRQIS